MAVSETCRTCKFADTDDFDEPGIWCRRYPRMRHIKDPLGYWCGEYRERQAEVWELEASDEEQPKAREPGWYWVRRRYCAWQPARADGRGGWNVGSALYFDDSWEEIGPRLEPPA
jgi:hypothetical protein